MFKILTFYCLGLYSCCLLSCASIPRAAPELSTELGKRLSAIEGSHMQLLTMFFAQKREIVDDFIAKQWIPVFAEEFFRDPTVQATWEEVVKSKDKKDRLEFILILSPALQGKINSKRMELVQPLEELERAISASLQREYTQARSMNNALTSFLVSASKVQENQQRYLDMIGFTEDKISHALNQTDHVVDKLISTTEQVQEKEQKAREFIEQLKSIKASLPFKR